MENSTSAPSLPSAEQRSGADRRLSAFIALCVGSAGVVYGDIGTSPLYAFKESIGQLAKATGPVAAADVIGVVSLMFWSLMIVVTLKYVLLLMRFDNRGEGGVLALMALVQRAGSRGARAILVVGMLGAGLFFGDAVLTPAISVLSAIEGLQVIEGLNGRVDPFIVPLAVAILAALFAVQKHGAGRVGRWFGPVCIVWFVVIAALGARSLAASPEILAALDPRPGLDIFVRHPRLAPLILGSVFLTVTGAEALYADMGQFGRRPIKLTWLALVFPCLTLNYLGQGALVLRSAGAADNPFFLLAPDALQLPLVVLATIATVIASQAVISGAFSMAQQAVQLGLLPRLTLRPTSEEHQGQVYAPEINGLLLIGVLALVIAFGSSSALASAYGVSVVGAMITSSILAVAAIRRVRRRSTAFAVALFLPFLVVETAFLGANLLKVAHGGYVPLLIAAAVTGLMSSWMAGAARLRQAEQDAPRLADILTMLRSNMPMRARGAAVYLASDLAAAPQALLHNLKHNQVLHETVVLLNVRTLPRPRVADEERTEVRQLGPGVFAVSTGFGFMESPDIPRALSLPAAAPLQLEPMRTSYFLSRRTLVPRRKAGAGRLQDQVFAALGRNATRAADYFQLPPSRVIELGAQVSLPADGLAA